jgi:Chaperone of endosialidase
MKTKNMTTQHFGKSIGRSPLRLVFSLISLVLVCLVLSPVARGQDGAVGPFPNGNTAEGFMALHSLTTGVNNTAMGVNALNSDTDGFGNTAVGAFALEANTHGFGNAATGTVALFSNTTGFRNTAMGRRALVFNTTGNYNTGTGANALEENTTGNYNTANGFCALCGSTTGNFNTELGLGAGENLTTENNNIDIGNLGVAGDANTIRIGEPTAVTEPAFGITLPAHTATFIAGIYGKTASGGTAVYINSSGQLGTLTSSARFKQDIHSMDKASEAILALQPVTFRYKQELDPKGIPQFGLVAEQVEKVNPDLVARDAEGKAYTVRYEAVNAMLLNEFLKEHRIVQEQAATIARVKSNAAKQEATIAQLKSGAAKQDATIAAFTASMKEQAAQIQKVSARLEVSKPAPRTVDNNQ